jgi:hypothetical protein
MNRRLTRLIAAWRIAKARLKRAKEQEQTLRLLLVNSAFPDPVLGTQYDSTKAIKLVAKLNYTVENDPSKINAVLKEIAIAFPNLAESLGGLISWNPRLSVAQYESLPDGAQAIFNRLLTIKPAMPQLSFVDEKDNEE